MNDWPIVDREPVRLPTLPGHDDELWAALIELSDLFGDHQGLVPRPSLLGAIIGKSVAVDVDDVPDAQRLDLALLLSLVEDPIELAGQLTKKDRQRLRARSEMADADERAWSSLAVHQADRGRAAFRLLVG